MIAPDQNNESKGPLLLFYISLSLTHTQIAQIYSFISHTHTHTQIAQIYNITLLFYIEYLII